MVDLLNLGWFKIPRLAPEVQVKLRSMGYVYNAGTVPHSLQDLTRDERLIREGSYRRYKYVAVKKKVRI